jgi:glycosyltransferase involved in cell wall biosynthesis
LESLADAGFDKPRLFIDHCREEQVPESLRHLDVTCRFPRLKTHGNWVLSAYELFIRNPQAERFAIFQDDFVTYKNLRQYLEVCKYPRTGYWNLYTFPENVKRINGWYTSNQKGRGAVALVFDNEALRTCLTHQHMIDRPLNRRRGWKAVDGGIVSAMNKAGWKEYCHNPSLVQHTGMKSSMGNGKHALANSFLGPDFDALDLVDKSKPAAVVKTNGDIGLVGYNCYTGLGELNYQLASHCEVNSWLVKPHRSSKMREYHPDVDTHVCPNGRRANVDKFLRTCDCVVFAETPYYGTLISAARERGKRLVCIPMMEWMPGGAKGWPEQVDLFMCPTVQCFKAFSHVVPCVYFPWPSDTEKFKFRERKRVERYVFINGRGGHGGRKGGNVIRKAKELWPQMPLIVYSQTDEKWPEGTDVRGNAPDNQSMYDAGDVLLYPASVDGLGLQPLEAISCGMPVISTLGDPWKQYPALARIEAEVHREVVKRPVDWYSPSAEHLVDLCRTYLDREISTKSIECREWSEHNSWERHKGRFNQLIREGVASDLLGRPLQ